LIPQIEQDPNITYYVINKRGDLRTNNHSDGPNAVTWGVFPGKEIVQPTIVEAISFMAWKVCAICLCLPSSRLLTFLCDFQDEAYELGRQWAKLYEPDSDARKTIAEIVDTHYLMNVVHNDYKKPEAIFEPFLKAGAEAAAIGELKLQHAAPNGHTNGSAH
jgi:methylenetetrahydrofolate reductase (NADPH)